jgi:hypothetical protein
VVAAGFQKGGHFVFFRVFIAICHFQVASIQSAGPIIALYGPCSAPGPQCTTGTWLVSGTPAIGRRRWAIWRGLSPGTNNKPAPALGAPSCSRPNQRLGRLLFTEHGTGVPHPESLELIPRPDQIVLGKIVGLEQSLRRQVCGFGQGPGADRREKGNGTGYTTQGGRNCAQGTDIACAENLGRDCRVQWNREGAPRYH